MRSPKFSDLPLDSPSAQARPGLTPLFGSSRAKIQPIRSPKSPLDEGFRPQSSRVTLTIRLTLKVTDFSGENLT